MSGNKSQKINALGIIFFLLLSQISLGENAAAAPASDSMALDTFKQNPTLENFNRLDPQHQADFLAEPGNYERYPEMVQQYYAAAANVGRKAELDNKYFGDANNIGRNSAADDTFFSGQYAGGNSRLNFHHHRESASRYLELKFGAPYVIPAPAELRELPADFSFNLVQGTLTNNGKKITFSQFQNDRTIREIRVIQEGFQITRNDDGATQEILVQGDAEREIVYDADNGQVHFQDAQGRTQNFNIQATTDSQSSFSFGGDGTLTITGPVNGMVGTDNHDFAEFTNRAGTLVIRQNGDITADNAEVRTSRFYGDGHFEKRGNIVTARDHGDQNLGNLENQRTVIIDIPSRVGAKTQNADGTMTMHLDEMSPRSEFNIALAPAAQPPETTGATPEATAAAVVEELRQQARHIRPPSGNLGKDSEVWVQRSDEGIVTVSAKGPVEVGFYNVPAGVQPIAAINEPRFIGENGISELDLQVGPQTSITLRGKGQYSDEQYRIDTGEHYGIRTLQDGSVMRITRAAGTYEDGIFVNCYECQSGQRAAEIHKTIAVATPSSINRVLTAPEFHSVDLTIDMTENGLTYNFPMQTLGTIASQQADGRRVVLGRDIIVKVPCSDNTECNFQLTRNNGGHLEGFYERYDPETHSVAARIPIDTGSGEVLGQSIIITSQKNIDALDTLTGIMRNQQFQGLRETSLDFDSDPALRAMVLQQTGLDIDRTDDPAYMGRIGDAMQLHTRTQGQIEQLRNLGIQVDENGRPATSEDANKINRFMRLRAGNEFYLYTAIQMNLARANTIELEATFQSCAGEAACPVTQTQMQEARRNNRRTISNFAHLRDTSAAEERTRQAQRQMQNNIPPADGEMLRANALFFGRNRVDSDNRMAELDYEIGSVDRQISELRTYLSQNPELEDNSRQLYEQQIDNYGQRRDSLLAERAVAESDFQFATGEIQSLTERALAENRPDYAAEVLFNAGDREEALAFAQSDAIPTEVRTELQRRYAQEAPEPSYTQTLDLINAGDLVGASREVSAMQQAYPDSPAFRAANDALADAFIQQGEAEARITTRQLNSKMNAIAERRSGVFSWLVNEANIANIPALLTGVGTVGDARETVEDRAIEHFENRRHSILRRNQIIDAYRRHGLSPAAALEDISNWQLDPAVLNDPNVLHAYPEMASPEYQRVAFGRNANTRLLYRTAVGQDPTRSDLARVALQEAEDQETFYDGKTGLAEPYFQRAAQYSDTPAGRDAQSRVEYLDRGAALFGLISNRALDTWAGDLALDSLTMDWLIPAAAVSKAINVGSRAVTTTARLTRLAKVAEVVGSRAAAVSRVSHLFAPAEVRAAVSGAREAVQAAHASGIPADIARAEEALARVATVASESSVLSRRVYAAPTARASVSRALESARRVEATRAVQATTDLSRAQEGIRTARNFEEASAAQRAVATATENLNDVTANLARLAQQRRAVQLAGTRAGTWYRGTTLARERSISPQLGAAYDSFLAARQEVHLAIDSGARGLTSTRAAERLSASAVDNIIQASERVERAEHSFRLGSAVKARLQAERSAAALRTAGITVTRAADGRIVGRGLETLTVEQRLHVEDALRQLNQAVRENPTVSLPAINAPATPAAQASGAVDNAVASVDSSVANVAGPAHLTPAENERLDLLIRRLTDNGAEFDLEGSHLRFTPDTVPASLRDDALEAKRLLQRDDSVIIDSIRLDDAEIVALADSSIAEAHLVREELAAQRAGRAADALPAVTTESATIIPFPRVSPEVKIAVGDDFVRAASVEDNFDAATIGLRRQSLRTKQSPLPPEEVLERVRVGEELRIRSLNGETYEGIIRGVDLDANAIYIETAGQEIKQLNIPKITEVQPLREITVQPARVLEIVPEPAAELAETGRLSLPEANALPPTERQIQRGRQLREKVRGFSEASPGTPEFQQLADDMHHTATQDLYGASKVPVFEQEISGRSYTLYEISMDRETLKGLNTRSYEIGSGTIDRQHRILVQFAGENGLEVTTMQKTTYIAVPRGSAVRQEEILAAIQRTERSAAEAAGQPIRLHVGIAENEGRSLMETRLHTRRSLLYSAENGDAARIYGNNVRAWYEQLPIESRANANDIFRGYDSSLSAEFVELQRLRESGDATAYREQLIRMTRADLQDVHFSSLDVVKHYQAHPVTGVREGDAVAAIDGISVGAINKEDALRLTRQNLPDSELAAQLGQRMDRSIREVNERIREAYFRAVDSVNIQPLEAIDEYARIAAEAGYTGAIRNTDDLKAFLRWEFEYRGRFRGGDETFMTFRREVLQTNPDFGRNIQTVISGCGEPCGYNVRVGVKEVRAGEQFTDGVRDADRAVAISKELGDVPVRVDAAGNFMARNLNLDEFEFAGDKVLRNGKELSAEAARVVRMQRGETAAVRRVGQMTESVAIERATRENIAVPKELTSTRIHIEPRAQRISENKFSLDGETYLYDSKENTWKKKTGIFSRELVRENDLAFIELNGAREGRLLPPINTRINPELDLILRRQIEANGDEIMNYMVRKNPDLESIFRADAGVGEGYTIRQHNNLVYEQFNSQAQYYHLDELNVPEDVDLNRVLKVTISLHDNGKPAAIAAGQRTLQHRWSSELLKDILREQKFSKHEIEIATNLVDNDILGQLATGEINPREAYRQLQRLATNARMPVNDFYQVQRLFYTSDAGSYPFLRANAFTELPTGRLIPRNNQQFGELEHLLEPSVLGPTSRGQDVLDAQGVYPRISSQKVRTTPVPTALQADTIPGALERIRVGQIASRQSELGKAYRVMRSTDPQTFSVETLGEVVDGLDDIAEARWIHGTNSRLLPNLRLTKDATGEARLLPSGILRQRGITPGGGEGGIGMLSETGINVDSLSGINTAMQNNDAIYHYTRLKGSYDMSETGQAVDRLDTLLNEFKRSTPGSKARLELEGKIRDQLQNDFDIFDERLLFYEGKLENTAGAVIQRERQFMQQMEIFSPVERELVEDSYPILISTQQEGELVKDASIYGESVLEGETGLKLTDPGIIFFVERNQISRTEHHLREVIGIPRPNVRSIESYDVMTLLTDSYVHYSPDGIALSPETLRIKLRSDPEFRALFRRQIENYRDLIRNSPDISIISLPAEEEVRTVVGRATGIDPELVNNNLIVMEATT